MEGEISQVFYILIVDMIYKEDLQSNLYCWDWRSQHDDGVLHPVKIQSIRNSCWAIVAADAIAAAFKIKHPEEDLPQLSVQELVDCCLPHVQLPAYNHHFNKAFEWVLKNGIRREVDYPMKGYKCPCRPKTEKEMENAVYLTDFIRIGHLNELELLEEVKRQPIAASIDVHDEFTMLKGSIYEGPKDLSKERRGKHGILIIGFGRDEEQKMNYWLVQNSWGTTWGVNGYGKIARNSSLSEDRQNLIYGAAYPVAS